MEQIISEYNIRKAIEVLKPDHELFEVRIIGKAGKKKIISGYFKSADVLLEALKTVDLKGTNVYITLNQLKEEVYYRTQSDCFRITDNTSKDHEVTGYEWLFIDLDPIRSEGISSSEEEIQAAYKLAAKVYEFMKSLGFNEPIKAISGNGAHLLYAIELPNIPENEELVKNCLNTLSVLFDNKQVKIDVVNHNPSRICKLYGTLAQKGINSKDRPHRMSRIISVPDEIKVNEKAYLEALVAELPAEHKQAVNVDLRNSSTGQFDLVAWMNRYGLETLGAEPGTNCTIYPLAECPFDHSHTDGDSKIFHYSDGAVAFKCHHNHCRDKRWQDVRMLFEPDAYTKREEFDKRIEEGWKQHNANKVLDTAKVEVETIDEPMFMTAQMIYDMETPDNEMIRTGINFIDKKMGGLEKTAVTVVTGIRGSAKSTVLSQLILNVVEDRGTAICYSGELTSKNFMKWMYLQAAGKTHTIHSTKYENLYTVNNETKVQINNWLGEHFWLYNNKFGNDFKGVAERIEKEIVNRKADLCILDNLMALDLGGDKAYSNQNQTEFVWQLKDIAQRCNCHIIFVAHPRKAFGFLRGDDIAGSGNLLNASDNGFIVHRANRDFWKGIESFLEKNSPELKRLEGCSNAIEIVKARDTGVMDEFIPLYYEPETRRLKNTPVENIVYGWESGFIPIECEETKPF